MGLPTTLFIAIGAILAALVAGFFSFLNLVSSKENKVSEFRQGWIDGLRDEIATFTSSTQALARFWMAKDDIEGEKEFLEITQTYYEKTVESLTKIQLRLNPIRAENHPDSDESKLLKAIHVSRDYFNSGNYRDAAKSSLDIRSAAAPLLKVEWERVKLGEEGYQEIRRNAMRTIRSGIVLLAVLAVAAVVIPLVTAAM